MAQLSTKARANLDDSQFAYPKHDALPIDDAAHVRAAMSRFSQTAFDSDADKSAAAKAILVAAGKFKVDVADDNPLKKLSMAEDAPADCPTCDGTGKIRAGHVKCPDCNGTGDAPDDGSGDASEMAEPVSLYALSFSDKIDLAEGKPIPFAAVGEWNFNEYGPFQVTRDDLTTLKSNFDNDVRRQQLPIINEAHDPNRAIGWIKGLEFDGDDRLSAVPEWTPLGAQLIADEAYKYTSPEMEHRTMVLHNWADPEHPGVKHPIVAAGLALTNFPKIKKLGAIAASEGHPGCELIACSETPVTADHPMRAALALFADPDNDGDDDGPTPVCINQPQSGGGCPGYTRRPGDDDGDGTCLMADKGCNGYVAVQQSMGNPQGAITLLPTTSSFTERQPQEQNMPETEAPEKAQGTETQPEAVDTSAALMAENQTLTAKFAEAEKRNAEMAERLASIERERAASKITTRFDELVRTGRIRPAQRDLLLCDEKDGVASFSETKAIGLPEVVIASFEALPANSAVPLVEVGITTDSTKSDASVRLAAMAEEVRKANPSLTKEQAELKVMETEPVLMAEIRDAERQAAGVR